MPVINEENDRENTPLIKLLKVNGSESKMGDSQKASSVVSTPHSKRIAGEKVEHNKSDRALADDKSEKQ
jgi:hypothetical protein